MRIIGLTGGIASGKSTVSGLLEKLGACIIDADKLARDVVEPGKPAWQEIVDWLGPAILLPDDNLNRQRLAEIVFSDHQSREKLESITHPRIRARAIEAVAKAKEQGVQVVVLDVPLLFEAGWTELIDEIWVVYVDQATQLARLMDRDGLTREAAFVRVSSQMDLSEKARLAQAVIDNSNDFESTALQVRASWRRVMEAQQSGIF